MREKCKNQMEKLAVKEEELKNAHEYPEEYSAKLRADSDWRETEGLESLTPAQIIGNDGVATLHKKKMARRIKQLTDELEEKDRLFSRICEKHVPVAGVGGDIVWSR